MKAIFTFVFLLLLSLVQNSWSANICNLEDIPFKNKQNWLDDIRWEFDNIINGYTDEALSLEQIPDLLLDASTRVKLPRAWESTEAVLNIGPQGVLLESEEHNYAIQRMLAKHASSEAAMVVFEGLGVIADIFVLGLWYEDVIRSFWSDSQTALDQVTTLFSIVPIIGESLMYYDYLSHLETTQTIVNRIQAQVHYSYSVRTPAFNHLSHSQEEVLNHYKQFKTHINATFKRLADVQILHFDSLYTAKVMEYETVLDAQLTHFDLEFFKNQMMSYNQRAGSKFGYEYCQAEQQALTDYILEPISNELDQLIEQLRQCNSNNISSNILHLWSLSKEPRNVKARELLFNAEQKVVDKAMLDLSLWREKFLTAAKRSMQVSLHNLTNSPSILAYQRVLYKKARNNAIRNFSLSAFQRLPTQGELVSGKFYVNRGELVCGIWSCSVYSGSEVRFNEEKDPVLEEISRPLISTNIDQYIARRIQHGWIEQELMAPFRTLLTQWQERFNGHTQYRPKGGNPALIKIEQAFPQLITVLEDLSSGANANQVSQRLDQLIAKMPMTQAWDHFGDFIFPSLYRLRQSNTQNLLPLNWQNKAWGGNTTGVLFNAFLSKPYLYLSSADWVQALPHYNSRNLQSDWFLYQGQGQSSYLSELPNNHMVNSDNYWSILMAQLASVSENPEIKWKPFTRLILIDYLEQLAKSEGLIQLAHTK